MITSPCKDCDSRATDCHQICEEYHEYKLELKRIHDEERKAHTFYDYIGDKTGGLHT